MSQRRRFFSATPVQQLPGARAEVEVMLTPQGVAAAWCTCEIMGAGWLSEYMAYVANTIESDLGQLVVTAQPDGRTEIHDSYNTVPWSIWEGAPELRDSTGRPMPMPAPAWHCTEIELIANSSPYPIWGALQGAALCDVRWSIGWDAPADPPVVGGRAISASGHVARAYGTLVFVQMAPVLDGSVDSVETLTATAFCDDKPVATLRLLARTIAY